MRKNPVEDGNAFQDELIEPATDRLLSILPGDTILDVGCGAGRFTRRMASLGAKVVAFDFCEAFIERAKERTSDETTNIEYHVVDATDKDAIRKFGSGRFDKAVATMCLMDMSEIDPIFEGLADLLKPGGLFVFSILHPCFNSTGTSLYVEEHSRDGRLVGERGVKVHRYLSCTARLGEGIVSQPEPHYYFERPMSVLFNAGFRAGFTVTGIEEPSLGTPEKIGQLGWSPEIPPVLIVRMEKRKIGFNDC